METMLLIALVAAVVGLITSMVILYNLLLVKNNRFFTLRKLVKHAV